MHPRKKNVSKRGNGKYQNHGQGGKKPIVVIGSIDYDVDSNEEKKKKFTQQIEYHQTYLTNPYYSPETTSMNWTLPVQGDKGNHSTSQWIIGSGDIHQMTGNSALFCHCKLTFGKEKVYI